MYVHICKLNKDYYGNSNVKMQVNTCSLVYLSTPNTYFIYSASMKSYQYPNFQYFGKYIIQLDRYFYVHVSGQRHTGLKK